MMSSSEAAVKIECALDDPVQLRQNRGVQGNRQTVA